MQLATAISICEEKFLSHANQQNENMAKANCFSLSNTILADAIKKLNKLKKYTENVIKPKTLHENLLLNIFFQQLKK